MNRDLQRPFITVIHVKPAVTGNMGFQTKFDLSSPHVELYGCSCPVYEGETLKVQIVEKNKYIRHLIITHHVCGRHG